VHSKLRSHLTYANVMATLAAFVALGGSSYAALRVTGRNVPKDALTGADIKNLTGRDVRNNSLTGADVKNLTSADVANKRLLAEDFAPGQLPRGEKGARGETGATGPPGTAVAYAHINGAGTFDPARSKNIRASTRSGPGSYCVEFAVEPKNVSATPSDAFLADISVGVGGCLSQAPDAFKVQVLTGAAAGTSLSDSAFDIAVN